jgi:hypothetical protein
MWFRILWPIRPLLPASPAFNFAFVRQHIGWWFHADQMGVTTGEILSEAGVPYVFFGAVV